MAQKMWSLFNSNQILNYLNQVLENQAPITIWQSSTQQLFQLKGNLTVVDEKKCTVSIAENDFELHDSEGIYFHCEGVDIIFKREKFSYSSLDNSLTFKTPSELMLKEKRRIDRFRFKYQDFKDVTFLYGTKSDEDGEKKPSVTFTLIDLSIAGLGCIGERKQVGPLQEGDEVEIIQISDQELEVKPLQARIRSFQDYDPKEGVHISSNESKHIRLGLEFDQAIDKVQFESVQSIITRTQTKTKGLDIDGFNGLGETEMKRIIRKASEENPVLAAELVEQSEDIDRLRYMTSEMKTIFWTEVNKDLLAQALRVASKELIYSLLSDVTDNIREEFLEELDRPKSLSAISKAQRKICDFIHQREKEGRFVLSAKGYIKYV